MVVGTLFANGAFECLGLVLFDTGRSGALVN